MDGVVDIDDRRVVLGLLIRRVPVLVDPSHQERAEPRNEKPADHRYRDLPSGVRPLVGGASFGVFKSLVCGDLFRRARDRGKRAGRAQKKDVARSSADWDETFKGRFNKLRRLERRGKRSIVK